MITWFSCKNKQVSQSTRKSSDDFVSLSSHELRSPLSIIKWYTEILLDGDAGPLTEDQRKYLTVIETSNQRAIDLVRSLLNVSRLDLGTFSIVPGTMSFQDVVPEAVAFFSKEISAKKVTVVQTIDENLSTIQADKHLVSLVVKQLLANAITFSKQDTAIEVTVSLMTPSAHIDGEMIEKESILLTVTDSGIGIPQKDQAAIFSKMFRAGNVKDSDGTGSGLGLYIAKTIMEKTGGNLWFTSEEGKGSVFHASFPTKGMIKKEGRTTLD